MDIQKLRIPICLATYLLFLLSSGLAFSSGLPVGTVDVVEGEVSILHQKQGAKPSQAKKGDKVFPRDELTTGSRAKIQITFINKSTIHLAEQSHLIITQVLYVPKKSLQKSFLKLDRGKIRAMVEKFNHPDSKFEIETKTAVAGVIGTEEIICALTDPETNQDTTRAICREGQIWLKNSDPDIEGEVILAAFEQSYILKDEPPMEKMAISITEIEELIQETTISLGKENQEKSQSPQQQERKKGEANTTGQGSGANQAGGGSSSPGNSGQPSATGNQTTPQGGQQQQQQQEQQPPSGLQPQGKEEQPSARSQEQNQEQAQEQSLPGQPSQPAQPEGNHQMTEEQPRLEHGQAEAQLPYTEPDQVDQKDQPSAPSQLESPKWPDLQPDFHPPTLDQPPLGLDQPMEHQLTPDSLMRELPEQEPSIDSVVEPAFDQEQPIPDQELPLEPEISDPGPLEIDPLPNDPMELYPLELDPLEHDPLEHDPLELDTLEQDVLDHDLLEDNLFEELEPLLDDPIELPSEIEEIPKEIIQDLPGPPPPPR